ncbi:DUF1439 domain-containing protein [Shewanella gelidii]|uniref:DUF1439 domain-containing protein n=1 Tax=Shewanella gelidii TaxID=1642821 RepID=A0A917NDT8_9GAMM|nr:DUF1439 domain-containing protein [Shewanella gelidii]MCL1099565.1 DUF1439 domain-containing protein [Shewanella gelidii]GGI92370.1 hypothetical protein GCM10009332_32070 [Shewanella gelidii]
MQKLAIVLGIFVCLMMTGCMSQYSISEKELESYLGKELKYEVKQGQGPFALQMQINDIEVKLGKKPDTMAVTAETKISLKNPLLPLSTYLSTTFEATPWYDASSQSIYLKRLDLVEVKSYPKELAQAVESMVPQLMRYLRATLESQPVYVLDTQDSTQAKIADIAQSIKVTPGYLVVEFKP